MPRGFKPVGWVAAVGGAALGCYMLSLNVAAERAELAKIEHRILVAKTDIRALQTELGTRGRLQQLEHWNAEVLALSAPSANQFVENELMLARFETREPTIEDQAKVQMASATTTAPAPAPQPKAVIEKKLAPADYAAAAARAAAQPQPMLRLASADGADKPQVIKAAAVKAPEPKSALAKAEPKKIETAKAEPKKIETARAEPKKVETAKVEPRKKDEAKPAAKAAKPAPTKTASADKKPGVPAKGKAKTVSGAGGQ
jgi:hypothetical protein